MSNESVRKKAEKLHEYLLTASKNIENMVNQKSQNIDSEGNR